MPRTKPPQHLLTLRAFVVVLIAIAAGAAAWHVRGAYVGIAAGIATAATLHKLIGP